MRAQTARDAPSGPKVSAPGAFEPPKTFNVNIVIRLASPHDTRLIGHNTHNKCLTTVIIAVFIVSLKVTLEAVRIADLIAISIIKLIMWFCWKL